MTDNDKIITFLVKKHKVKKKLVKALIETFFERFYVALEKEKEIAIRDFGYFHLTQVEYKKLNKRKKIRETNYRELLKEQYHELMYASGLFADIQRRRRNGAMDMQHKFFKSIGSKPLLLNNGISEPKDMCYLSAHVSAKDYCKEREFFTIQNEKKLSNF